MPKQTAPIARNLNTTAQSSEQNGVEASIPIFPIAAGLGGLISSLFN
ncbi:MAG: hypothetical protein WA999_18955 [Spirulinaceae cyanobacterium]